MLFNASTLNGLVEGRVSCTFRRWTVVRPKVGSLFTTRVGMVRVTSIEAVAEAELTEADAERGGYRDLAALLKFGAGQEGQLYRIGIELAGPDPRIALRAADRLTAAEVRALDAKLARMDAAGDAPWTRRTLEQIRRSPGVVSTTLAADVGQERQFYKIRVRRLKALGLTESLEVGYRLSARGTAYLDAQHLDGTG